MYEKISIGLLGFLILVISPFIYDENRKNSWAEQHYNVIQAIDDLPPSEISIIGIGNHGGGHLGYLFSGNNFQHDITFYRIEDSYKLYLNLENNKLPEYLIEYCFVQDRSCPKKLEDFESTITPYGYTTEALDTRTILLKLNSKN